MYLGGHQDHPQVQWFTERTHRTLCNHAYDHGLLQQKDTNHSPTKGKGVWGEIQGRLGAGFQGSSCSGVTRYI